MKKWIVGMSIFFAVQAMAEVKVNEAAPDFSEKDAAGKQHSLKDYKGKWLVLEWYNKECPYVKKHYGTENMQNLQKFAKGEKVQWLTVISSAEGKQGYLAPKDAVAMMKAKDGPKSEAILIDSDGNMGKAYDAKTTPHMFVINPEGKVVYAGAIDDNDSANPKSVMGARNFVRDALVAGLKGQKIAVQSKTPYGCSVKY